MTMVDFGFVAEMAREDARYLLARGEETWAVRGGQFFTCDRVYANAVPASAVRPHLRTAATFGMSVLLVLPPPGDTGGDGGAS